MYFDKVFYNEEYKPLLIQFICDKCGKYFEFKYSEECISKVDSEYCVVSNGEKIFCECGNRCQNGLIEPKKGIKIINVTKQVQASSSHTQYQPKCPICGSTNLSKITGAQKAMKIAAFGVFGMGDNGKTWKCNNCGSKF